MHRKTLKPIPENELFKFFSSRVDGSTFIGQSDFNEWIKQNGYSRQLINVDFGKLAYAIFMDISKHYLFANFNFINCVLPAMQYQNCTFHNCRFVSNYEGDDCSNNLIRYDHDDLQPESTPWFNESQNNIIQFTKVRNPTIAVVYAPNHGTYYTDKMTNALKARGINILRIYCNALEFDDDQPSIPKHPLFDNINALDGFLLPGGFDVETSPDKYSDREKLEAYFVDLSLKYKIPLLGVCRGHQFVGHYLGAGIDNVHHHRDNQIYILPEKASLIAKLAEQKLQTQQSKGKKPELFKIGNVISYTSTCAHSQGLFVVEETDPRLKVTAQSLEGLPESLQVDNHIITFQHHHEGLQEESFPRACVKMFATMVNTYHTNKNAQTVTRSKSTNLFRKREAVEELDDTTKVKAARGEDDVSPLPRRR